MSERHLTEHELVLVLDEESRASRAHVADCPFCRARLDELESALTSFAESHRQRVDEHLAPIAGPRAQLRASLEQASARHLRWWHPVCAMAVCLALFAIVNRPSDLSKPRITLTPGETRSVSLGDVCRVPHAEASSLIPVNLRQQVFREYGIRDARPGAYEVDYLITPDLGGVDSLRNLWPQPYSSVWNAHVKDELEERLHGLVCSGQVDLATAQRDIARDWIGAYKKYFHSDKPVS